MVKQLIISLLLMVFNGSSSAAAAGDTSQWPSSAGKPLTITVGENNGITLQSELLTKEVLVSHLHTITQSRLNTPITIYPEPNVSYGRIIEVMGLISAAGYRDVKLASPPQ